MESSLPTHRVDPNYNGKYSREDLEKVRAQLIKEIYDKETYEKRFYSFDNLSNEINTKRKCGLLSDEVKSYFKYNIKPANRNLSQDDEIYPEDRIGYEINVQFFTEPIIKTPILQPLLPQLLPIPPQLIFKPVPPPSPTLVIQQQQQQIKQPTSSSSLIDTKLPISFQIDTTLRDLKIKHGCIADDFKFCPKLIKGADQTAITLAMSIVYICDNCQTTVINKENMLQHLKEKGHLSASEYYIEKTISSEDFYQNTSVKYVKNRSTLLNSTADNALAVFCPKCDFPFSKNLVACSLHYSFVHTPGEYIYSLSERTRSVEIYVTKSHSCFVCKRKFKKLIDLTKHLEDEKHFPENPTKEISVLNCLLDNCSFKSVHFFPFKQHLLGHKYMQEQSDPDNTTVPVRVYYYLKPTKFYHVTPFKQEQENTTATTEEHREEAKWIDSLVEIYKGHNDSQDICKRLKIRRDHLLKYLKAAQNDVGNNNS